MSQQVLKAEKLNKYFHEPDTIHVLHDISMSVEEGEFVSIMGKSGSGKSTLLYLLSTLDTQYEGTVDINGTRVTGLPENAMARFRNEYIGFVFQFHFLLPEFTALENVMLPALKLGKRDHGAIEQQAMEKLRKMDLHQYAHKLSGKLSGGQQQRVAIARALINDPRIIMADEPTGNLDSANTANIFDIFNGLVQDGNTIIVVTHDHDFARKSTRILEMADGRICTNG
ncbi:ATP-binding protein [Niastella yeongjuensis]|uniref:ATP-binding protein n=1 Tax=Niastella yeongjuensis TaxID=354355 RepID=A0A1V9EUM0_9BACT|nr:ABC transporter ATP-binding protein [Niastella yeongjuensis]OQP49819.1 ATP-binding protein [Niastella yeongjuensis]SEP40002.1 lipoprotein-releasing system ATP-binding protein [Niastella yeongjuensis]